MAFSNDTKPSDSYTNGTKPSDSYSNGSKPTIGDLTWSDMTKTWANELRTWVGLTTGYTADNKPT